jgi:hypothetical protein
MTKGYGYSGGGFMVNNLVDISHNIISHQLFDNLHRTDL